MLSEEARARIRAAAGEYTPEADAIAPRVHKKPLRLRRAALLAAAACLVLVVGAVGAAMGLLPGPARTAGGGAAPSQVLQAASWPAAIDAAQARIQDAVPVPSMAGASLEQEAVTFSMDEGAAPRFAECDIDLGGAVITGLQLSVEGITLYVRGDWDAAQALEVEVWQESGVYTFTMEAVPLSDGGNATGAGSQLLNLDELEVFWAFQQPVNPEDIAKLVVNGQEIVLKTE